MNLFKRIVAGLLVACTAISLAACSDTTWAYDYEGAKISSGLYIAHTMTAYAQAQNHADIKPEIKDFFKQTIEGKTTKQWIIDTAKTSCDRYISVNRKFDELGLSFTESDNNIIDVNTKSSWESLGTIYEKNGVGEKTHKEMTINQRKANLIFEKYYGKGGIEEVKDEDLLLHYKENYATVNSFTIPLATGDTITDEQKKENEALKVKADELAKMINDKSKTFNEAYDVFFHYKNKDEHDAANEEDVINDDAKSQTIIKKDSTYPSEKLVKAVFNDIKVDGDAVVVPDTDAIYIIKRYDVTKDATKFDEMREEVLMDIKSEPFEELQKKWAAEVSSKFTANKAAIKRYKPENIDFSVEAE